MNPVELSIASWSFSLVFIKYERQSDGGFKTSFKQLFFC